MSVRRGSSVAARVCLATAWLLFAARSVSAQETITSASVSGRVVDPSGASVSGATVTARDIDTNVSASTTTGADGRFRFSYLHVGPYEIVVTAAGFSPATRAMTLTVGAAFDLSIALAIGPVTADVSVTASATTLETARSQIASTISASEARHLPMNGRNFLDLALLAPAVSPTNAGGGTQIFPETSAVPGVGLSVSSQRNLSNSFIVDGLSDNDDAAALSGAALGVDAIDQFQVVTSGGQAELGRALGGSFNIVTRSGTNTLTGDSYGYFRDDRLNGINALSGTKLPMHQNQYGTSLGGPLRRSRTFFFVNAERRDLTQSGLVTIPADTAAAINGRLAAVGYQGPGVATGIYPNPIDSTVVLGKIDERFSDGDMLSVRYNAYDITSGNARGAGGTSAPSASAGLDNTDQNLAVSNIRTLSPRLVLETRAQFAYGSLAAPPADPIGPAVSISGIASFGTLSGSPTARVNKTTELVNNLSYQAGAHAIRGGVDVLYNDTVITYPRAVRGSYSFSSLANFLSGTFNNGGFTQTFGSPLVALTNPNVGMYVQDEWALSSRVTVNAGLRYDLQYLQTIETDTNNLSPRLGVVWSADAASRTIVRVSGGRYYDRLPLRALANALLSAGNTTDPSRLQQISVSLSPGQTDAPAFPDVLTQSVATSALVNFTTMDPHIQDAYSNQISVEIEHRLGARMTVAAGYDHLGGHDLIAQINQNVPACVVSGSNNGCRPNPAFANNSQYRSAGDSVYDGLHVSLVQRPIGWGEYRVSYTFSKAMNDVGEAFFNGPVDNFDIMTDWGRSDDDQRHRLVASFTVHTPTSPADTVWRALAYGFSVSGMIQWYSALPFNVTTGANTIQGTAGRPLVDGQYIARNSGVGSDFSTVNLRLSRALPASGRAKLELFAEAFNVLDRVNPLARVTVFGAGAYPTNPAPNFGTVTVVGDPRSIQLGFRVAY